MSDEADNQTFDPHLGKRHRLEIVATVLLTLGSLVTSWSGYQASLWSRHQATDYARANTLRMESARESTFAGQLASVDAAMLMAWVNARKAGDHELEQFYSTRFRPEFHRAFEAWLATQPMTDPKAPSSPFVMPSYQPEHSKRALELDTRAVALFDAGHLAGHNANTYVLGTVLIATALFCCGIAQLLRALTARVVVLGLATLLLMFALSLMVVIPRA